MLHVNACHDLPLLRTDDDDEIDVAECVFVPTADFVAHHNDTNSFVFVLPGSTGRVEVRDSSGTTIYNSVTAPGVIRVLAPGERSALRVTTPFRSLVLRVPSATCRAAASTLGVGTGQPVFGRKGVLRPVYPVASLLPWFREAIRSEEAGRRRLLLAGVTDALLLALVKAGDREERSGLGFSSDQLTSLLDYAETRLAGELNLTDWAAAARLPSREFARRFRSHFGVPPYEWFLGQRIDRALQYLAQTDLALDEIATLTGFSSQSHFSAAFRRRVGVPPGTWRAAH